MGRNLEAMDWGRVEREWKEGYDGPAYLKGGSGKVLSGRQVLCRLAVGAVHQEAVEQHLVLKRVVLHPSKKSECQSSREGM